MRLKFQQEPWEIQGRYLQTAKELKNHKEKILNNKEKFWWQLEEKNTLEGNKDKNYKSIRKSCEM